MNLWCVYFKFMASQLCTCQTKEITMLDIIENFENFKNLNQIPINDRKLVIIELRTANR